MRRKSHVRFLGGDDAAMHRPYPTDVGVEALLFSEHSDPSEGHRAKLWCQVHEREFTSPIAMFVAA